jgi:hypothetical protein
MQRRKIRGATTTRIAGQDDTDNDGDQGMKTNDERDGDGDRQRHDVTKTAGGDDGDRRTEGAGDGYSAV